MVAWDVVSAGWAIASAVAVVTLGFALAKEAKAGSRGSVPFAAFAVVWGLQVVLIHVGIHASAALAPHLFLFAAALISLQAYLLVEFSAAYAKGGPRSPPWRWIRRIAGALALLTAAVIVVDPSLILKGTVEFGGTLYPDWGLLELPLFGIPRTLAFGVAVWILYREVDRAPTSRIENRLSTIAIGLALYAAYTAGNNGILYGSLAGSLEARFVTLAILFGALGLVCLCLGWYVFQKGRRSSIPEERRRSFLLAAALVVPLVSGGVERGLVLADLLPSNLFLVGLWRLAGVGVIAYGLARWRVPDLPDRVQQAASSATGAVGAVAGGATAYGAGALVLGSSIVPALLGLVVTGGALFPGMKWARRLLSPEEPGNPVEQDRQRFEQRIDAYRAALEASLARGTLDEDEAFLEALRERFEISDKEDRVVRYYAHQAVVPTSEGDPDQAYERIRILGEGGAGRTWLARDRARDRLVVLKEPLSRWQEEPAILDAARREAKLAAKIRHPNVVEVEEVIEDDGVPVLVMEHVAGGSLEDLLRSEGTLAWREAVSVTHDVACGLAAVHSAGIVHRDIKPSNVLVTEDGRAKLTDFGIARERNGGATKMLESRSPLGTEMYMAPEVRSGSSTGDQRSDVFTCTALLFTCLHGRAPSEGGPVVESDVPAQLEKVLAKGLAVDPGHRYEDAEALAGALEQVIDA